MAETIFSRGVDLLLYGMGTVILFLVLLIVVLRFMSWMIQQFLPESKNKSDPQSSGAQVDEKVVAVIGAAIKQSRVKKRNRFSS